MKLSYNWLREWVDFKLTPEALAEQITMAGLEVDSCTPVGDDAVLDIQLTPNRGDCLSVEGMAREVAVLNETHIKAKKIPNQPVTLQKNLNVKLEAGNACLHYSGRIIENVRNTATSPDWMQERLQRADTKCISPVVDIMNYVMLELGQPLHAFDFNTLHDEITVRKGKPGEQVVLLNNQTITVDENVLLIADSKRPIALAGIMGGLDSSVTLDTTNIFIESAYFSSLAVLGRARRFNLVTDGAHRWERGVDPFLATRALERATELVLEICGGNAGPVVDRYLNGEDNYSRDLAQLLDLAQFPGKIDLAKAHIKRILGIDIPDEKVHDILSRLGLQVSATATGWQVQVPSYRYDLRLPDDLIEEIARIYGYINIPATLPRFITQPPQSKQQKLSAETAAAVLVPRGYQEVITYSFIDPALQSLCEPDQNPKALLNPIASDLAVMRTSLLPGLLNVVQSNQNRQQERVRCFEHGLCFLETQQGLQQPRHFAGVVSGSLFPEQWRLNETSDFYTTKDDLMAILALTHHAAEFSIVPKEQSIFHPGRSAVILNAKQESVGYIGAVHPNILQTLGIKGQVFGFELFLSTIAEISLPQFKPLSRFPAVRRDIAMIIKEQITAKEICDSVRKMGGTLLVDLSVFDVYQGKSIPEKHKSMAIRLTLQHQDRTLTDAEVDEKMKEVIQTLNQKFDAILRV